MKSEPFARRVSLRDIAKLIGVSHATVSMALRESPRVSAKVRAKVQQIANELGYRPDPMLTALASYRQSKTDPSIHAAIAWINAWPRAEQLRSHKEFDHYWKGASEAAAKSGYRLEEFRLDSDLTPQRLHQILNARGIRGILLPPHRIELDWGDFPWEEYSVARFGRSLASPLTHLVTADHVTNTGIAVEAMRKRGYRRIGYVTTDTNMTPRGHLFGAGFQEMIGDEERVPVFKIGNLPPPKITAAFRQWMKKHKPDAILTAYPEITKLLSSGGYRAPEDVGLAVLSILDGGADSGIDQHPEEIGRVGFLLLNSLINEGNRGIPEILRQILVEGKWVDGTSLPPRNNDAVSDGKPLRPESPDSGHSPEASSR